LFSRGLPFRSAATYTEQLSMRSIIFLMASMCAASSGAIADTICEDRQCSPQKSVSSTGLSMIQAATRDGTTGGDGSSTGGRRRKKQEEKNKAPECCKNLWKFCPTDAKTLKTCRKEWWVENNFTGLEKHELWREFICNQTAKPAKKKKCLKENPPANPGKEHRMEVNLMKSRVKEMKKICINEGVNAIVQEKCDECANDGRIKECDGED